MKSLEINTTCQICNKTFSSIGGLHLHLSKTEKITQKCYYQKFFPRFDLNTKKQIPFSSYDKYKNQFFTNSKSEFEFLDKCDEMGQAYLEKLLSEYAQFPNYVMWASKKRIPYDRLWDHGNFNIFLDLAKQKYAIPYDYTTAPQFNVPNTQIMVDTREQKPLFDTNPTTLNVGDYALSPQHYNCVHIDRKSLPDFISTFTIGLDRFKRECKKAESLDLDLVVMVEEPFEECLNYIPAKWSYQKVTGANAFHGVRQIIREYNIQFVFADSRDDAKNLVKIILNNKELIKQYDLQFCKSVKYL